MDAKSKLLTTFVTLFGHFCFIRLPFGISSFTEIFQRTRSKILRAWRRPSVRWMMSSLTGWTSQNVMDAYERNHLQEAELTLNAKCEFSRCAIRFLTHIIDSSELHANPQRTAVVTQFPVPLVVSGIQRFIGMVNHLRKCIPILADLHSQLLRKDSVWVWGEPQQKVFEQIKQVLVSPTVLAHYHANRLTIIPADASNSGISAVFKFRLMESAAQCVTHQDLSVTQRNVKL